jgi:uncharacterized membrane protein
MCNAGHRYARRLTKKIELIENEVHQAMAVMDEETGQLLNYIQFLHSAKYKKQWNILSANKFGWLANESKTGTRIPPIQSNSYAKTTFPRITGKTSHMDPLCTACD